MITFQDYEEWIQKGKGVPEFVDNAISEHKASLMYSIALDAENYIRQQNTTIFKYRKLLYTITGKAVPDNFSANHKCASNYLNRFVTQENQYLLGNGIILENEADKKRLGRDFDERLQKAGKKALTQGASFLYWNYDRLEVMEYLEFVPLWDEETGDLRAGIRFWQICEDKPTHAMFFEADGFTRLVKENGKPFVVTQEKRAYMVTKSVSIADGEKIVGAKNYGRLPIVVLWGCPEHQSALIGLKENIDCYDLIKSGFANDLDDASMIYWTISNAGGMTDIDLVKFVERMKTIKAAAVSDDGAKPEAHTLDIPYQSREAYLTRLETDLYNDARALNVEKLSAGNVTATAIRAAYQALDDKCDDYEYCLLDALYDLFEIVGITTDSIVFKRNRIANETEETQMVLSAASVLDTETILRHLPFLSPDEINDILERLETEEEERYNIGADVDEDESEDDTEDEDEDTTEDEKTNDKAGKKAAKTDKGKGTNN